MDREFELETLSDPDIIQCQSALRMVTTGFASMEESAQAVVAYLAEHFIQSDGSPAFALVRFYKTHPFGSLEEGEKEFALAASGSSSLSPTTKCLVLLASRGEAPGWNDRRSSANHRAIALTDPAAVAQMPMIARLVSQFGLGVEEVLEPDPELIMELDQRTLDVFYVGRALGSRHIPSQEDFVIPYGIRSVIGFGGTLLTGDLFAVIMFSKVEVTAEVAHLFRGFAGSLKPALYPFGIEDVFSPA